MKALEHGRRLPPTWLSGSDHFERAAATESQCPLSDPTALTHALLTRRPILAGSCHRISFVKGRFLAGSGPRPPSEALEPRAFLGDKATLPSDFARTWRS